MNRLFLRPILKRPFAMLRIFRQQASRQSPAAVLAGTKGQAAIMDALFFMTICAGASALLIHVAGLYGATTNQQLVSVYNAEYASTALVSLHYARDATLPESAWFWNQLKWLLAQDDPEAEVVAYLDGDAHAVWVNLSSTAPTPYVFLRFKSAENEFTYPGTDYYTNAATGEPIDFSHRQKVVSSTTLMSRAAGLEAVIWTVSIDLYY